MNEGKNTESAASLIDLDLGANGGVLAPKSFDELAAWVQKEQRFWDWVRTHSRNLSSPFVSQLFNGLDGAANSINSAANQPDPGRKTYELNNVSAHIRGVFQAGRFPHSSTPLAMRVEAYRKEAGDDAAIFFLAAHVLEPKGQQIEPRLPIQWRGWLDGLLDKNPPEKLRSIKAKAYEMTIESLRQRAETMISAKQQEIDVLQARFDSVSGQLADAASEAAKAFLLAQGARAEEFGQLRKTHEEAFAAIRKTYNEEMALRGPVNYWKEKIETHSKSARKFGWVVAALLVLGPLGLGGLAFLLFGDLSSGIAPPTWELAVFFGILLFLVWSTRLAVRNYLSHLHLQSDAQERVVMVKTYLALAEGGNVQTKDDRQIILHSLFRPATDGLVKDEGVPLSLADLLTRK